MRKLTTLTDSNLWDDMIDSEKEAISAILEIFTDGNKLIGDYTLGNVVYDNITNVYDYVADNYRKFEGVMDKFKIIARLLDIREENVQFFEDVMRLGKLTYGEKKTESSNPRIKM